MTGPCSSAIADDIVPEDFGPDLPPIRDWTEEHYDFAGYVTGFDPPATWAIAASSATATTSASASSPWAARAWEHTCCGG